MPDKLICTTCDREVCTIPEESSSSGGCEQLCHGHGKDTKPEEAVRPEWRIREWRRDTTGNTITLSLTNEECDAVLTVLGINDCTKEADTMPDKPKDNLKPKDDLFEEVEQLAARWRCELELEMAQAEIERLKSACFLLPSFWAAIRRLDLVADDDGRRPLRSRRELRDECKASNAAIAELLRKLNIAQTKIERLKQEISDLVSGYSATTQIDELQAEIERLKDIERTLCKASNAEIERLGWKLNKTLVDWELDAARASQELIEARAEIERLNRHLGILQRERYNRKNLSGTSYYWPT